MFGSASLDAPSWPRPAGPWFFPACLSLSSAGEAPPVSYRRSGGAGRDETHICKHEDQGSILHLPPHARRPLIHPTNM